MNKKHVTTLSSFLVFLTGAIFIAVFSVMLNNSVSPVTHPAPEPSPTTTIDSTKNWEIYTNDTFSFSLKYPPDLVPLMYSDDFGNVGYVKFRRDGDEYMIINLSDSFSQEFVGRFMGSRPVSKKLIGGEDWNYYNFYYQDSQIESLNYNVVAYEIVRNDFLYRIVFENQTSLTEEQEKILSSFKFVGEENLSTEDECIISGCNREICASKEMFSPCIYKPEYECYESAKCEVQSDGECGWTIDEELVTCIGGSI